MAGALGFSFALDMPIASDRWSDLLGVTGSPVFSEPRSLNRRYQIGHRMHRYWSHQRAPLEHCEAKQSSHPEDPNNLE